MTRPPIPTDFAALDALYPLPPEALPRQWVLAREASLLPAAWTAEALGGWHFAAHPEARVHALRAADGSALGWAVDVLAQLGPDGDGVPEATLTLPVGADPSPEDLERALYGRDAAGLNEDGHGLEGRWAALVIAPSLRRVYVNPTGSLVYSPQHRAVATSHNLIPGLERDEALSRAFDPLAKGHIYGFGLTAHRGLRRLLSNHVLDLDTFEPRRHWPVGEMPAYRSGHEGVGRVVAHTRRLLRTVFAVHPRVARLSLTAGRDSRAMLAILRPFLPGQATGLAEAPLDVFVFTKSGPTRGHRMDVAAARRVARLARLPHHVLPNAPRDGSDVLKRFVRIGEARAGPMLFLSPVGRDPERLSLTGMNGAIGRGIYWPRLGFTTADLGPELFARFAKAPKIPAVFAAADAWRDGLPAAMRDHVPTVMELLYVEHREGSWSAPLAYMHEQAGHNLTPFRGPHNIGAMLRLPVPYRARREFQHDIVRAEWPELMAVPFNEPVGRLAAEVWLGAAAETLSRRLPFARLPAGALRRLARLVGP